MKLTWTRGLALVIGGIVLGSMVSVAAQDGPAPESKGERRNVGSRGHHGFGPHGALRSESVVPNREGFVTVRTDRGELIAIDGEALRIRQADGHEVVVTASGDTRFRRDGADATLADLKVGDQVHTERTKTDGAFTTRSVRAMSPERYAEMPVSYTHLTLPTNREV